jgi:hypothetical protein
MLQSVVGSCAAIGALGAGFAWLLQPSPMVFKDVTWKLEPMKKTANIRLLNLSSGPMYIHSLLLKNKNGDTLRPDVVFRAKNTDRYELIKSSYPHFGDYGTSPIAWSADIPLVTVRPRTAEDGKDDAYAVDFFAKLRVSDDVFIEVVSSSSAQLPLGAWKVTRTLSIQPQQFHPDTRPLVV